MADLIVKAAVKDAIDGNISADFYDALDEEVNELLDETAQRAKENDRKTFRHAISEQVRACAHRQLLETVYTESTARFF